MLNLSAAFDTIDHNCLFYKLRNYFGITGNALKWLTSYLTKRSSEVVTDNVHSLKTFNNFGVPQGSLFGPLLFILYINELTDVGYEFGLKMHSYADDTTLYIGFNPATEFHTSSENLKSCLNKMNTWMTKNFLKLYLNKTQLLVCGKKRLLKYTKQTYAI